MMRSSERGHPFYHGLSEGSATETRHYRCECGALFPILLVVAVDAQQDPELAERAMGSDADEGLNYATCPVCQAECHVEAPMTYHAPALETLVLVLPEFSRHCELQERAGLLMALAAQETPVPSYAVEFVVAYGPEGLAQQLEAASESKRAESRREGLVDDRIREVAAREFGLEGRQHDLERLVAELDSRSSTLTERELALQDRKGALDRRSAELEAKTEVLVRAQEKLRADTQDDLPSELQQDSTQTLSAEDILTSAPDPNVDGPLHIPTSASVSGSSVRKRPRAPDVDSPTPAPILLEHKKQVSDRATTDAVTDEQIELKDTDPILGHRSEAESSPPGIDVDNSDTPAPTILDEEIRQWCEERGQALKLLRGRDVRLIASVPDHSLEELGASDIRALLQLHKLPTYPLVTLTLARATTLAGQPGKPYSFHFDVGSAADREVLDQLAKDFRFKLEIFSSEYRPSRRRRLAAPLAANVRYVVALAVDTLRDIPNEHRSFERAINAFGNPRYDRLGRSHPLARDFKDSQLDRLDAAPHVRDAIALCERFSASHGEEYLVAIRSYPFERWHQRRLQVIRRALDLGLWMGPTLAQVAVSEGLVRSPRELVARCQSRFASFISTGAEGLSEEAVDSNWAALEAQALTLGILGTNPDAEADTATSLETADSPQAEEVLIARLSSEPDRMAAIAELSRKRISSAIEPISRALAELSVDDAAQAFADFTRMGTLAASALLVFLDCPTPHLRHAAALALCELRDDEGVDSICEALMAEDGGLWREYAFALGQVGAAAIMPVVARVAGKGKREQARAVWALGYIAGQGGRKSLETLTKGRDAIVAQVAGAALELEGRLRDGSIATERDPVRSQFSEVFYNSLSGLGLGPSTEELSGQAMQLDEADLLEASDP